MSKFEAHINPSGTLKLKKENGEEDIFTLKPLPYKYLPKIFKLLNSLKDMDKIEGKEDASKLFEILDEETISLIQELELETFKRSYPEEDVKVLEDFIMSNLFEIMPIIFEINSFNSSKK